MEEDEQATLHTHVCVKPSASKKPASEINKYPNIYSFINFNFRLLNVDTELGFLRSGSRFCCFLSSNSLKNHLLYKISYIIKCRFKLYQNYIHECVTGCSHLITLLTNFHFCVGSPGFRCVKFTLLLHLTNHTIIKKSNIKTRVSFITTLPGFTRDFSICLLCLDYFFQMNKYLT